MKRHCLFFLILLSQSSLAEKVKGYYILFTNDTIFATFEIKMREGNANDSIPDLLSLRKRLLLSDNKRLGAYKVKEYLFVYNDIRYRMVSREKNRVFKRRCFFRLKEGNNEKLKLLIHYKKGESYGPYDENGLFVGGGEIDPVEERIYLQKKEERIFKPSLQYFKEDVFYFLNDCPRLKEKYQDEEFLEDVMQKLVAEYNWVCGR